MGILDGILQAIASMGQAEVGQLAPDSAATQIGPNNNRIIPISPATDPNTQAIRQNPARAAAVQDTATTPEAIANWIRDLINEPDPLGSAANPNVINRDLPAGQLNPVTNGKNIGPQQTGLPDYTQQRAAAAANPTTINRTGTDAVEDAGKAAGMANWAKEALSAAGEGGLGQSLTRGGIGGLLTYIAAKGIMPTTLGDDTMSGSQPGKPPVAVAPTDNVNANKAPSDLNLDLANLGKSSGFSVDKGLNAMAQPVATPVNPTAAAAPAITSQLSDRDQFIKDHRIAADTGNGADDFNNSGFAKNANIAEYTDKDGTPTFTNIGDSGRKFGDPAATPTSVQAQAANNITGSAQLPTGSSWDSAMKAVQSAKTGDDKIAALSSLEKAAGQYETQAQTNALQQAGVKLGLPQMESQLRVAEAMDRADPMWQRFQTDSPITEKLRAEVNATRNQTREEAAKILLQDPQLASMKLELNSVKTVAQRSINKMDSADQKNQEMLASTPPQMIDSYAAIHPEYTTKATTPEGRLEIAQVLHNSKALGKDDQALLQADDTELPSYLASNDKGVQEKATKLLIAKELGVNGGNLGAAQDSVSQWNNLLGDDTKFQQWLKGPGSVYKKQYQQATMAAGTGLNANAQNVIQNAKASIVKSYLAGKAQSNFMSDASKWQGVDLSPNSVIGQAIAANGGKTDMDSIISAAMKGAGSPQERAARRDQLMASIQTAISNQPKSNLLPSVQFDPIRNYVNNKVARSLLDDLSDALGLDTSAMKNSPFGQHSPLGFN